MTEQDLPERESMEFDVVIVGAGPAGLAAAIRLKQVNPELSVVVLEKGAEVGKRHVVRAPEGRRVECRLRMGYAGADRRKGAAASWHGSSAKARPNGS